MAHPYTTIARVRLFAIAQHADRYLDRDADGIGDAGVIDSVIARACNEIDSRLGLRWEVPFASLPSTPGKVSDIADRLALVYMLEPISAASDEVKHHWTIAQSELDRLAAADAALPGADPISTQRRRPVRYSTDPSPTHLPRAGKFWGV